MGAAHAALTTGRFDEGMEADRTTPPQHTPSTGRIGIARERAFTAKLTLFAGAAASFGVAMVLVRASHPAGTDAAGGAQPSGAVTASASSDLDDEQTSSGFAPGDIGSSSGSTPDFGTRSS